MKNNDITLKNIQDSLINFNTDTNETKNTYIENELMKVMNLKGYYVGFNGHSNDIINTFDTFKNELFEAKGLFIQFQVNEEITMTAVGDIVENLNSRIDSDIYMLFDTVINNIDINCYEYKILLTGLSKIEPKQKTSR